MGLYTHYLFWSWYVFEMLCEQHTWVRNVLHRDRWYVIFLHKTNIPHVLRSPVTSSGPKLTGTHQCSGFSSCNPRCGHPSTAMSLLIACQSKRVTSFSLMMDPCWCYQCYCSHYFNSSIICWNYGDDINYTVSRGH